MLPNRLLEALADRYRIERELGQGGMATVYLAEDLKHHRKVAIKVLRPELAAALGADRFLREIETTANLRHPHILPLFDSGTISGDVSRLPSPVSQLLFYVMPFVDGESLRSRLDREKQLPIDDALQVAREVADALSYAHAHGVIHRDIKPENILLESGHAVVADFGIARAINAASGDALTETGMAIGTVQYMSPEQAAGQRDLDGRSDLYALGCVLYEMLAGQAPFTGPTVESIIHQHMVANPPPITQLRPAVPADVAAALQRALAKTPADRFNPVAQFASALQPRTVAATTPVTAAPRGNRALLVGGALVALAAIGFLLFRSRNAASDALPVVGRTTQVTRDPGLEVDPALSPDGQSVAYAAGPPTAMQVYVRQVSGGRPVALTNDTTGNFRWPRWSPDGSQVAYQANDGIYLVPPLGGAPRRVARVNTDRFSTSWGTPIAGFDWSPDGARVAWASGYNADGVMVLTLATGDTVRLAAPASPFSPAWSPDGATIAVAAGNSVYVFGTGYFANAGAASIWLVHLDGRAPTLVAADSSLNLAPQWSPDGRHLFWISDRQGGRDVYRQEISRQGAPVGTPQRVTTGSDAQGLSLSRRGERMAWSRLSNWSAIWSIPVPARGPVSVRGAGRITTGNETIESIDVSPDGRTLAFDSDRSGNFDIFVLPVAGGEARQLTSDPAPDFSPVWSPDGSSLVFHSQRTGNRDVFTMDADGTGLQQRTSGPAEELDADWSPDGSTLVFAVLGSSSQTQGMATLRLADGAPPEFVAIPESDYPRWTPDGRSVLYHSSKGYRLRRLDTGLDTLFVASAELGADPFFAVWSPDGSTLYFLARSPERWSIRSMPATGGASTVLVDFDDPAIQQTRFGFATDGKRFYFTVGSPESDIWVADLAKP